MTESDRQYQPTIHGFHIQGKAGKLNTVLYMASGDGQHPVVIFAHGFPGHERNVDLAQTLRRMGFHSLLFSYRGCWGSEGSFSFGGCIEDTETVLDYILSDATGMFDRENIFIIGHSVGSSVIAPLLSGRRELRAGVMLMPCDMGGVFRMACEDEERWKALIAEFTEDVSWVSGANVESLVDELAADREQFSLLAAAEQLLDRPLLMVSGKYDKVTPPDIHCAPLLTWLQKHGSRHIYWHNFPSDHYLGNVREQLAREVSHFLNRYLVSEYSPLRLTRESLGEYLDEHFATADLSGAADYFHLSVTYFCRRIRQDFGTTFHALLLETRMKKAEELLEQSGMTVRQIALELGWEDSAYFMKVFKTCHGMTPSQYRGKYHSNKNPLNPLT